MNRLPLKIALRYLVSKKSHTAVSIISAISVCAVAVTAMAMICVLSVFNGFGRLVNDKLSLIDPQLKVVAAQGKAIANADSLLKVVRSLEGVEMAEPTITDNALAIYGDKQVAITLKGVTEQYGAMTQIDSLVKEDGEYALMVQDQPLAVVSVGTAVALGAHPGYVVPLQLYSPKRRGAVNPANPMTAFRQSETYISGVFEVQQSEYDINYVIVPIEVTRHLFDYTEEATAIEVKLSPGISDAAMRDRVQDAVGSGYIVQDRLMQHSNSLKMINVEKWIAFLLMGFILVIASFNIISTLAILIIEKEESIAALRSMGADNKMISRIFVAEGWLISFAGAVVGLMVGIVLCLLQQHFGFIGMGIDAQNLIIDSYPVELRSVDVLSVLVAVAVVGFLTSSATAIAMRRRLRS